MPCLFWCAEHLILSFLLWACFKVLVIVVIVCKCLLISSVSPFYACCSSCFPPPSSTPHLLSSCAQTLRPALKPQLTVGTSPSFFCQHSMAFSACQLSTVRHVTATCTGCGNETNVDLLYMCLSVCPSVCHILYPYRRSPVMTHPFATALLWEF